MPEDGHVWLRCRSEVVKSLEETERCLGHLALSAGEASSDRLCDPCRVSGKDLVVRTHSEVTNHSELHYELVDKLLFISISYISVLKDLQTFL